MPEYKTRWVARLKSAPDGPAWSFRTKEHAEEWASQFGNKFEFTEVQNE